MEIVKQLYKLTLESYNNLLIENPITIRIVKADSSIVMSVFSKDVNLIKDGVEFIVEANLAQELVQAGVAEYTNQDNLVKPELTEFKNVVNIPLNTSTNPKPVLVGNQVSTSTISNNQDPGNRPARVGNKVTEGYTGLFDGTSWGSKP